MGSNATLLTTKEVADYLGTSRGVVYWYVRTGRLRKHSKRIGKNKQPESLYALEDVQLLFGKRKRERATHGEALARAVRAEAISRDLERRVDALCELFGLVEGGLDTSDGEVRLQHRRAVELADPETPGVTDEEATELARMANRINEEYLRLVELHVSDPEPWCVYMDALRRCIGDVGKRSDEPARALLFLLNGARRHLRQVAFEYVRTARGHIKAEEMIEEEPAPFDDAIVALVLARSKVGRK